jgi:hypothetical protein
MKKSLMGLTLVAILASVSALANGWQAGVSYSHLTFDDDINMGTVNAEVGYNYLLGRSDFSVMPALRIGTGVVNDEFHEFGETFNVDIERFTTFAVRASYHIDRNMTAFIIPSYNELEVSVSNGGVTQDTTSDWEFGMGFGMDYRYGDNGTLAWTYERVEDANIYSLGYQYQF